MENLQDMLGEEKQRLKLYIKYATIWVFQKNVSGREWPFYSI